ncbi:MAG: hypothetical protein GW859_05380 [Sphingomonadales bacterium]|nr:hypothetical protein [Sphingomonadales bacterium]
MSRAWKVTEQDARRETLARLRLTRPLTPDERAEEERLERRLAKRVWLAQQAEVEARIAARLNAHERTAA